MDDRSHCHCTRPGQRSSHNELGAQHAGAGAITEQSGAVGPVRGGAGRPPLEMEYVDLLKDVKIGERVLTSGLDGVFPRGFLIGTVERAVKGSGVYSDLAIRPATDFADIHVVLVILARPAKLEGGS